MRSRRARRILENGRAAAPGSDPLAFIRGDCAMTEPRSASLLIALGLLLGTDAGAATYAAHPAGAAALAAATATSDEYGRRVAAPGTFSATPVHPAGGGSQWTSLGPAGGDAADVAASPTAPAVVLAGIAPNGSYGGTLYRSADSGASWSEVTDLAGLSVFHIAFAGNGTAYAATQDSLWTSGDDGASWSRIELGLGLNDAVLNVTVDPADDASVWACNSAAIGQQTVTVMHSADAGATWQDVTPPDHTASQNCSVIAIDPGDSNTVVAGFRGDFGGGEVWLSSDGGGTWSNISTGLPDDSTIYAATFAGSRLLVGGGLLIGSQSMGLFASDDLGQTWTPLHDATWPLLVVNAIAVDPSDPQTILAATGGAGLNRSTDGGATWEIAVAGTAALSVNSARFVAGDATQALLGATSLAVFKSTDTGETFAQSSHGISELALYSIASNPVNADEIAVAFQGLNSGGVFDSIDGGATWTMQPQLPPTRYSKVGFAADGTLYAISDGPTTIAQEGLYKRNADASWTNLGPDQGPYFESDLDTMRFSANDPNLIFLGGADFGVPGFGDTVWRSTDAGATWTKVYDGDSGGSYSQKVYDLQIVADGTDQKVVAVYDGQNPDQAGGVLLSTDGGTTWNDSNTGLPTFARIPKLCQATGSTHMLFLSAATTTTTGGVFLSDDGGASWTPGFADSSLDIGIACDPSDASTLYLARGDNSNYVMRSTDGGATFAPYADGLAAAGVPTEIVAAANQGATQVLLSTYKGSFLATSASDRIFADGFELP